MPFSRKICISSLTENIRKAITQERPRASRNYQKVRHASVRAILDGIEVPKHTLGSNPIRFRLWVPVWPGGLGEALMNFSVFQVTTRENIDKTIPL